MVSTVNPKAKLTPSKPMPTAGNAAARTALPHPPKTSQKVPMNSAVSLRDRGIMRGPLARSRPALAWAPWINDRGAFETGQEIVADFDRRISAIQTEGGRGNAIYMTPTGVTSGPGTLIHEMLVAAGYNNYATREGWQSIPLERFVYEQPDAIAGAFFNEEAMRPAQWSATRHPVAKKQMADRPTARLQGAWTSCGGWFLVDAIEVIAALPDAETSSE